ncbi:MAG: DUF1573 domain-containing protein [Crocinitomicaceae bacterium]|nr:DUF1573 domain-containing protein [Crocinitomicaceae bacterium]
MKYVLFLGVSFLFTAMSCTSETDLSPGNRTTMEVAEEFDAGEVVKGEFITAKFKITNTGDYPLFISDVKAGCTCTVAKKPEEPIAPGESGEIVAQVDTDKTGVGGVSKSLRIVSNTDIPSRVVKIKATVLKN